MKLLDWVLAERDSLAKDKKRLDYLTHFVERRVSLYRQPETDGPTVLVAAGEGVGQGETLREAIDAAQRRRMA